MRMRNFVLFGMAFASLAVYAEPINLGCSPRGPLAALSSSAAFREAIGDANPANFLGSVYDVNEQQLSPQSTKALQCPLFIDSDATPSASASKAILSAEAGLLRAGKPEKKSATPTEDGTVVISSAAGVVDTIQLPPMRTSGAQERPQAAPKPKANKTQRTRTATAVSRLRPDIPQIQREAPSPKPQLAVQAEAVQSPRQVEKNLEQSAPTSRSEENLALSVAQTMRLIRRVETRGGQSVLEFNPLMAVVYFLALFVFAGALALPFFQPRPLTAPVHNKFALLQTGSSGFDSSVHFGVNRAETSRFKIDSPVFKGGKPVQAASRRESPSLVAGD